MDDVTNPGERTGQWSRQLGGRDNGPTLSCPVPLLPSSGWDSLELAWVAKVQRSPHDGQQAQNGAKSHVKSTPPRGDPVNSHFSTESDSSRARSSGLFITCGNLAVEGCGL